MNEPLASSLEVNPTLEFGHGRLFVVLGTYNDQPAVFVAPASKPGVVGTYCAEEDGDPHALKPGEYVLTFPTEAQALAVADALCNKLPSLQVSEANGSPNP